MSDKNQVDTKKSTQEIASGEIALPKFDDYGSTPPPKEEVPAVAARKPGVAVDVWPEPN